MWENNVNTIDTYFCYHVCKVKCGEAPSLNDLLIRASDNSKQKKKHRWNPIHAKDFTGNKVKHFYRDGDSLGRPAISIQTVFSSYK